MCARTKPEGINLDSAAGSGTRADFRFVSSIFYTDGRADRTGDPRGADGARMTGELLNIEQEPLLRDRFELGGGKQWLARDRNYRFGKQPSSPRTRRDYICIYICVYVHRKLVKRFYATRGESNFYRADGCWVYCR